MNTRIHQSHALKPHAQTSRVEENQIAIRDEIAAGSRKTLPQVVITDVFAGSIMGMVESMTRNGRFDLADAMVPTLMRVFIGGRRATG